MKISTIFIANLAEIAQPLTDLMERKRRSVEIYEDHALCDRFMFSCKDNSVLVTPFAVDKGHLNDTNRLLSRYSFLNMYPKSIGESLCRSIMADERLYSRLIKIIQENPNVIIKSYAATPSFIKLIMSFKKKKLRFLTPEIPQRNAWWTAAFFDSKAGFRQTLNLLDHGFPSMPKGAICHNIEEIIGWSSYFLKHNKGFVLKANRGLAGAGLKIIKKSDVNLSGLNKYLTKLIESASYWQKDQVIVEEFITPDKSVCGGAPNVELKLVDNKIEVLYVCGMRITTEGNFRGVEMGQAAVPKKVETELKRGGIDFGRVLKRYGYRGFFEIDWVYANSSEFGHSRLYPIEANLRRTGGTHVYELGKKLLGNDFLNNYYLIANNMYHAPTLMRKTYRSVKKKIKKFLYPMKNNTEGVIITGSSYLTKGNLGYVVISKNRDDAHAIENKFLELL